MLLDGERSGPRAQRQSRAATPLLQERGHIGRRCRLEQGQNRLLVRFREARESVLQKLAQFWVLLTQAMESGSGLIWRTPKIRASLCQGANPGGQRGLCRCIHT